MTREFHRTLRATVLLAFVMGCVVWLGPSPASAQEDAPDPLEATRQAFMAAETPEARLAVATDFLDAYPQHPRVGAVLDAATGILLNDMQDREGAIELVVGHLAQIQDAEIEAELQDILISLYSDPAYGAQLTALIAERYDVPNMSFSEHLKVIEAGIAAEAWGLVDEHSAAAEPQATVAAFRADYPDRDFSDDYIETAGRNRQGLLKTFTGWAAANQDDLDQAEKDFEDAKKLVRESFFGLPDNDLYRYWGQTLVMQGKADKGLQMLALAGIYGMDHDAATVAEQTYIDLGKNPAKYDDFLMQIRMKHAPMMANFTANDYKDADHEFKDLIGEKATLLAFWFPT